MIHSGIKPKKWKDRASVFPFFVFYSGFFFPQLLQKLPVFVCPQSHFHGPLGFGLPQLLQKFPLFTLPQPHVQDACFGAAC